MKNWKITFDGFWVWLRPSPSVAVLLPSKIHDLYYFSAGSRSLWHLIVLWLIAFLSNKLDPFSVLGGQLAWFNMISSNEDSMPTTRIEVYLSNADIPVENKSQVGVNTTLDSQLQEAAVGAILSS